jgi:hypothetical protein
MMMGSQHQNGSMHSADPLAQQKKKCRQRNFSYADSQKNLKNVGSAGGQVMIHEP